jgi:hypothetical protein
MLSLQKFALLNFKNWKPWERATGPRTPEGKTREPKRLQRRHSPRASQIGSTASRALRKSTVRAAHQ